MFYKNVLPSTCSYGEKFQNRRSPDYVRSVGRSVGQMMGNSFGRLKLVAALSQVSFVRDLDVAHADWLKSARYGQGQTNSFPSKHVVLKYLAEFERLARTIDLQSKAIE